MSVITFLSDFGADSHYTASFRGALLRHGLDQAFIEISSSIEAFDIIEAAYISSMVYKDFPKNTVHILATNVVATSYDGHVIAKFNEQFFIAPDNGILSLIFGQDFSEYYLIPTQHFEQKIEKLYPSFIRELFDHNFELDEFASKTDKFHTKSRLVPVKDSKELRGTVLFVDHFGNAYTNISRSEFEGFIEGRNYRINLSRHEWIDSVSNNFADVQEGDTLCYFSDHDHLVVAIKKGNAERLLNLRKYKPLIIELI